MPSASRSFFPGPAGIPPCLLAGLVAVLAAACWPTEARAQNDWQYPDPYFGILEIEKSHDGAASRRQRTWSGAVSRSAAASPSPSPTPGVENARPGAPAAVTPLPPPHRPRSRSRWRRER